MRRPRDAPRARRPARGRASTCSSSPLERRRRSSTTSRRPTGGSRPCLERGRPLGRSRPPGRRGGTPPAWSFVPVAGEVRDDWARRRSRATPIVARRLAGVPARRSGPAQPVRRARARPRALLAPRRPRRRQPRRRRRRDHELADLAALLRPGADLLVTRGRAGGLLVRRRRRTGRTRCCATCRRRGRRGRPDRCRRHVPRGPARGALRPAIACSARRGGRAATCGSRPPPARWPSRRVGLDGVPDRAAVNVRRARERVRRALRAERGRARSGADPDRGPSVGRPTGEPRGGAARRTRSRLERGLRAARAGGADRPPRARRRPRARAPPGRAAGARGAWRARSRRRSRADPVRRRAPPRRRPPRPAAEPAEQVRAVDARSAGDPRARDTAARSGASATVRVAAAGGRRSPAGPAGDHHGASRRRSGEPRRRPAAAGARRRDRVDRGRAPSSRQAERLVETPGPGERPGEAGEVAGWRGADGRRRRRSRRRGGRAGGPATGRPRRCGGRRPPAAWAGPPRRNPRYRPGISQPSTSSWRRIPSSSAPRSAAGHRPSGAGTRRRTIGSRSRWPAWTGASRRAIR